MDVLGLEFASSAVCNNTCNAQPLLQGKPQIQEVFKKRKILFLFYGGWFDLDEIQTSCL